MKYDVKLNIVLYDIMPILFYIGALFILLFVLKLWIALIFIIPIIWGLIKLNKNLKNFKSVQEKINNLGNIIYENGSVIFSNISIISLEKHIFTIDYTDISCVYLKHRSLYYKSFSLCIIDKNNKKYELVIFNPFGIFPSHDKEIQKMVRIIKSHNIDVKLVGKISNIYEGKKS